MKLFKIMITTILLVFFMGVVTTFAGQTGIQRDFNYYSPIQLEGTSKYKAIFLTDDVYEYALPNLADLRIKDEAGSEVPYYIQKGSTSMKSNVLFFDSKKVATKQEDNNTLIDFKIEPIRENSDVMGNKLIFTLPEEEFLKHLLVYGSFDGDNWTFLTKDYIYHTASLNKREISFDKAYKYSYYRVTIMDNAERITIPKLQLLNEEMNSAWKSFEKTTTLPYKVTEENKETVITIENSKHLKMKNIYLDINGNFQRTYSIYDADNQLIYTDKEHELYKLNFKDINISDTNIELREHPETTDKLTIKIKNNDNPPLHIENISVSYFIDKLVFEDKGNGPYYLYFGNKREAPQYDLVKFKSYIENEIQDKVSLGSPIAIQTENATNDGWFNAKNIFNAVIILVSMILIGFIMIKLNKAKE